MAIKELPCVVLENNNFRIVAKERTKQRQSFHALHMVVDLNDDVENQDCVDLVAEMKHRDSLGNESWSSCNLEIAKNDIIASQVRTAMELNANKVVTKSKQNP